MVLNRGNAGPSYWNPLQLHFHAPSEHTLNGELFPAEMHIVHVPGDGSVGETDYSTATDSPDALAVLGVWFEELDCESMEDSADCLEERAAADAFFGSMVVFGADPAASFD